MRAPADHGRCVDGWLAEAAANLPNGATVDLCERALAALWARAHACLGEVTLLAVADRVLHDCRDRYPESSAAITVDGGGFNLGGLKRRVDDLDGDRCRDLLRFIVVEFLVILGRLTADVLSSALHEELRKSGRPRSADA